MDKPGSGRHHKTPTSPLPIPPNGPSPLLQLIQSKAWPAVLKRIESHPHEVGSAPCFRNERGYTALHCLVAYNRFMAGEELAKVAIAILAAAERIDWGVEYTLDEVEHKGNARQGHQSTSGSWRLLMDQKNQARWSPLHLVFVQGGVTFGKVPLARALLQISDTEEAEEQQNHMRVLLLTDRQNRSMLHHNCETCGSRDDNLEASHFLISQCPAMLFVKDVTGNTPLEYILSRLEDGTAAATGITLRRDHEDRVRNYKMLKLLVCAMEREGTSHSDVLCTANGEEMPNTSSSVDVTTSAVNNETVVDDADEELDNHLFEQKESGLTTVMKNLPQHQAVNTADSLLDTQNSLPRNILHCACRLSKSMCRSTSDGSLILFLISPKVSELEYERRSKKKLIEDRDETGNYALHIFLQNRSYVTHNVDEEDLGFNDDNRPIQSSCSVEYRLVKALLEAYPSAISTANHTSMLPLRLAMETGLQNVISLLVQEYPEAVLMDPRLEHIKIFTQVLVSLSRSVVHSYNDSTTRDEKQYELEQIHLFSTMYFFVRSRPDVVTFGRSTTCDDKKLIVNDVQAEKSPSLIKKITNFWKKR